MTAPGAAPDGALTAPDRVLTAPDRARTAPDRVLIVDDHPIWREAVERDLVEAGFLVVAAVADGESAVRLAPAVRPDVVLMDLQLPGISGVEATAQLVAADPSVRVLMFSSSGEDADVLAAVKAGARGYLVKSAARPQLLDAVSRTAAGEAVFSPGLAALVLGEYRLMSSQPRRRNNPELTERETEVLRLVATGRTARQVADALALSHRTVQNHVQNTLRKLQLHNKVELTRWAIEQGVSE
ncbi:MAG: response regulator transcription factor [Actinomycetota bacterium]|nr:response regulator transcription factor [Actinomycetota bacterium]